MLRLYDVQSGRPEPITGAPRGELRILVYGPCSGPRPHLGDLRWYLLPDLIRRWAQRAGMQVLTCEFSQTEDEGTREALRTAQAALNIHPPDQTSPPGSGPDFDISIGGPDGPEALSGAALSGAAPSAPARKRAVVTGRVTFEGHEVADLAADADGCADDADGVVWLSDVTGLGLDALALRLAFFRHRYRDPADLTWDALLAADRALRRWRERVAEWATEPSAPLVRSYADAVTGAFEDDLDTPSALRHLQALEADSAAPPGAKFETFAFLDLLLGLDLARDIGRY